MTAAAAAAAAAVALGPWQRTEAAALRPAAFACGVSHRPRAYFL